MMEKRVKPRETVEITWTKSPFHKPGTKESVHPVAAQKLVNSGMAISDGMKVETEASATHSVRVGEAPGVMSTSNTVVKGGIENL